MTTFEGYKRLKEMHADAVILMRCGSFYKTYNNDAADVSRITGVTLTTTSNGTSFVMFPNNALDTYLPKIIRAGKRIAIADGEPQK